MIKKICKYLIFIVACTFFIVLWTEKLVAQSQKSRLEEDILTSALYREQYVGEEMVTFLQKVSNPGEYVGLYLLESKFGYKELEQPLKEMTFNKLEKQWKKVDQPNP